jgi:SAM-dependent methyltransferase
MMKNEIQAWLRRMGYELRRTSERQEREFTSYQKDQNRYQGLFGGFALQTVLEHCTFETVLDVGSGAGKHADEFERAGKRVTTIDIGESFYYQQRACPERDIQADYLNYTFDGPFDLVWACHVLEHQPNPNIFLTKIYNDLRDGGWIVVSVPPLKMELVGGHVSLWTGGLLLYQLVLAGFDCRHASVLKYGYNISVIVKKKPIDNMPALHFDKGDIERLLPYLPTGLSEGCSGEIFQINWPGLASTKD